MQPEISVGVENYEYLTLPSNGIGFQELKELHVRPMTMKEEKMLGNKSLVKAGKLQEEIFKACVSKGIDKAGNKIPGEAIDWKRLLMEDEYALLIFIRAISYGTDYEPELTCPVCGKKQTVIINFETDLPVTYADDNIEAEFKVTLPKSGKRVTLRLPERRDSENDIWKMVENCIVELEGTDPTLLHMVVQNLIAQDVAVMRKAVNESKFGVTKEIIYHCGNNECPTEGEPQELALPLTQDFFRI